MLSNELSFNTIAGYKTAISEIHDRVDGCAIGSHLDIARMMHAIHYENPLPAKSDDPIDIIPSLDFIKGLGDNSSMTIRDLSIKTAFLLALVTASRPSDLRRIDLNTMKMTRKSITFECIKPKEYNIAKAHSLFTSKHQTKKLYIGSYEEDLLLCPYNAFTTFMERTRT